MLIMNEDGIQDRKQQRKGKREKKKLRTNEAASPGVRFWKNKE